MAGMECGALTACPSSNRKRKAAEAVLGDGLCDGENDAAVDTAAPSPPVEIEEAQGAADEALTKPMVIMSQEWIDSVLAKEIKPLPLNERLLRKPHLAAIFHSHEQSRAKFAEYQNWIRRELETKGYVEVDDDYDERCALLQAVHEAVFYGREDEEKEAMAKLEAMRLRRLNK